MLNVDVKKCINAGFDQDRLMETAAILDEGAKRNLYPGGVLWVNRREIDALVYSTGYTDFSRTIKVDHNTLYDLASLTKPIATASAILLLAQDGLIHFDQHISDLFPQRDLPHLRNVTLHHLLTHTSGLPVWQDLYSQDQTRTQAIDELFQIKLINEPGTTYTYSCLGYIILGLVAEDISGVSLDQFCCKQLFRPLGMNDTVWNPGSTSNYVIAVTDNCSYRHRKLVGEVHDGNSYALGGISGNAGLFSTAADIARYCSCVMFDNMYLPIIKPMIDNVIANKLTKSVGGQTYGWYIYPNHLMPGGDILSKHAIGHTGFTGTMAIIDPDNELFIVLLTNRVCNNNDGLQFRNIRKKLINAIHGAIVC